MGLITLTAVEIVGFIFTKVSETLIGKATESVLPKINELRLKILAKLKNTQNAKAEIDKAEQGSEVDLELLADYLKIAMREDPQFQEEVTNLANEINQEIEDQGQGANVINVYGGKAYQQNHNRGKIYNAETITIHEQSEK